MTVGLSLHYALILACMPKKIDLHLEHLQLWVESNRRGYYVAIGQTKRLMCQIEPMQRVFQSTFTRCGKWLTTIETVSPGQLQGDCLAAPDFFLGFGGVLGLCLYWPVFGRVRGTESAEVTKGSPGNAMNAIFGHAVGQNIVARAPSRTDKSRGSSKLAKIA